MHEIYVIEDDHNTRVAIRAAFEKEGHIVSSAADGQTALDALKNVSGLPCVILLDMSMAILGGADFINALSLYSKLAKLPVVQMHSPMSVDALRKQVDTVCRKHKK